jgi:hypothetical protein
LKRHLAVVIVAALPPLLAGCDMLGIESASDIAARREADGRAVGAACRYSARPIEQCFELNKRVDRAAIFAGWREMNDYMRENKMDAMPPVGEAVATAAGSGVRSSDKPEDGAATGENKSAARSR